MSSQPHDTLFKAALSRPENAIGALRAVLPAALLAQLDLSTLQPSAHDTFVDDASLRAVFSDLVFEVQLAGRPALVAFVLYEHQSTDDPLLIVRLDAYKTGVWRRWLADHPDARRVPPVIAVVLYHGAKPWSAPTSLTEVIDAPPETIAAAGDLLPAFRFVLDDLCRVDEDDLRAREVAVLGRVALLLFKFARSDQLTFKQLADKVKGLLALLGKQDTILTLRYIITVVPNVRPEDLVDAFRDAAPSVKETAMTLAERLLQQGRQEGRLEGQRELLLKFLRLKFGDLGPEVEARVRAADGPTLDAWSTAILTAGSVAEVLGSA